MRKIKIARFLLLLVSVVGGSTVISSFNKQLYPPDGGGGCISSPKANKNQCVHWTDFRGDRCEADTRSNECYGNSN